MAPGQGEQLEATAIGASKKIAMAAAAALSVAALATESEPKTQAVCLARGLASEVDLSVPNKLARHPYVYPDCELLSLINPIKARIRKK
jgi:hypothetical protein